MSKDNRHQSTRATLLTAVILFGLLLASLSPLLPRAFAATSTGVTEGIVNVGQLARDSSSAIPIFGFNMTATTGEHLVSLTVTLSGSDWQPGNDRDLRALNRDPRISGVGIFRDDGVVDDALDPSDTAIVMASTPTWNGNDVSFDFTGINEPVPLSVTGKYQWIVAIRTSVDNPIDLIDRETITATIRAGSIVATNGAGFVSQPLGNVVANPLTVDLAKGFDIVGNSGFPWVGPSSALVNSKAVLGLHVVDGGVAVNRGIQDSITSLRFSLVQTGGAISSGDFQPISTNPGTSGIALYLDNGPNHGVWDAGDTGVTPVSISPTVFPAGGVVLTMTFSPALLVPHVGIGSFDFFLVVRTKSVVTGDSFRMDIRHSDLHIRGLLASMSGTVDADLRTPSSLQSTSDLLGDSTPPRTMGETWLTDSNYLFASGLNLYFAHAMTTTQIAYVTGLARDDESGLASAAFSSEPSLASSPGLQTLARVGAWEFYAGAYGINNMSLATSSPADVTVCDRVGNCVSTSQEGKLYNYLYVTSKIIILPNPGWSLSVGGTPPFWIDPSSGKLWFSNLISTPGTATINVQVASLSGVNLASISASARATLGGPNPATTLFPAGTFNSAWSTSYTVNASSNGLGAPLTITASDNLGNVGTANFDYGLDTLGPSITVVSPSQGSGLSGNIVAKARVSDASTRVASVQFVVDGRVYTGFFDGMNYFAPISTADFTDGKHRLQVQAWDMVGNQNTTAIDVAFSNAATGLIPPTLNLVTPLDGSSILGQYAITAAVTDSLGIASVNFTLRRASDNGLVLSAPLALGASGYYQATLDTAGLQDGTYTMTVTAVDTAGLSSTRTIQVRVKNQPSLTESLVAVVPLALLAFLVLAFLLALLLLRSGKFARWMHAGEPRRVSPEELEAAEYKAPPPSRPPPRAP